MGRYKGTFNFSANYEGRLRGPIDAKTIVEYYSDLIDTSIWADFEGNEWTYVGMLVTVYDDPYDTSKGLYFLNHPDYWLYSSWTKIATLDNLQSRTLSSSENTIKFAYDASYVYIDVSLASKNLSSPLNTISITTDASNVYIDVSIASYVKEASLGPDFYWNPSGYLEVSSGDILSGGPYVKESSLGSDFYWDGSTLEVSIGIGSYLWSLASDNTTIYPTDPCDNVRLSYIEMRENGGELLLVNMPISDVSIGSIQSYAFEIDGSNVLRIYSVGDGSGVSETAVVVDADYIAYGDPSTDGSWRHIVIDGSLHTQVLVDGVWRDVDTMITFSNVGVGDASVYFGKVGTDVRFRSLEGAGAIEIINTGDIITIGINASFGGEINIGRNLGSGAQVYAQKIGNYLEFRSLSSSENTIKFVSDASHIYIDVSLAPYVKESSLGSDFYWSPSGYLEVSSGDILSGGPYVKESSLGNGLAWNASTGLLDTVYETSLDPSLTMASSVGGIPEGTTVSDLNGNTITDILDQLLFPTINPAYVPPSASFAMSPTTTLYEVSTLISLLTFTTMFSRGSIYLGTTFQNYRSGSCNYYDYTYAGNGVGALSDVASNVSTNIQSLTNYYVAVGTQSWNVDVSYDAGPQPYDSDGDSFESPLAAGHVAGTPTRTIEGAYPLYATTVSINTLTKQDLVSMSADIVPPISSDPSGFILVAEVGGKWKFEIPVVWPYTDLTGIRTYNSVGESWDYELGSATASLTRWTITDTTETIQGYVIPYKRYTYNNTNDRASTKIRLEI
jgi:hypothetical protein